MSPVAPRKERNPRTMVLGLVGVVVALILLIVVFVFAIPSLTESGKVQVRLGTDTFDAGLAKKRADAIRRDGPILFSDVASGQRDIFLQHLGEDDTTGWSAFDARRDGQGRECTLSWDPTQTAFTDPCDGSVVVAAGSGLTQYKVVVSDAGTVVIDLNPDHVNDPTPTSTASSTTTSSLIITGSIPK
jgi:type II secretory pathway pseudopilin PulG